MNLESINKAFSLSDTLTFIEGEGGLPMASIRNAKGSALISLYAGQVLQYQRHADEHGLLFLSSQSAYQGGKAIRGGVPICWPWFGADPEGLGRANHGFARTRNWSVISTQALDDGETELVLGMDADAQTREIWPHDFALRLRITVGDSLRMSLQTRNTGEHDFVISQALHTYFEIGDVQRARVLGLDGLAYIDKALGGVRGQQDGELSIDREIDRIYQHSSKQPGNELVLQDDALKRRVRISSSGSRTSVVWNPWRELTASMADLGDEDYRRMLCVETANAADDVVSLQPGEQHELSVVYRLEAC